MHRALSPRIVSWTFSLAALLLLVGVQPAAVQRGGVCGRTAEVGAAIAAASGRASCGAVTVEDLGEITALDLSNLDIARLSAGDFGGLVRLRSLDLSGNALASLPENVFDELYLLETLHLDGNALRTVPPAVFDELLLLEELSLGGNPGLALPDGLFGELSRFAGIADSGEAADGSGVASRLRRFLASHDVANPEDFIAALPALYRERFVLVYGSATEDYVSYAYPRVVSYGGGGRLAFAWDTAPGSPPEVQYLRQGATGWAAGAIDFSGEAPRVIEPVPCAACGDAMEPPAWMGWGEWEVSEFAPVGDVDHAEVSAATQAVMASPDARLAPLDFGASAFAGGDHGQRYLRTAGYAPYVLAVEEAGDVLGWRHAEVVHGRLKAGAGYRDRAERLMCGVETADGAVAFLAAVDLWQSEAPVRRLYRETPNTDTLPDDLRGEAEALLYYGAGTASAEDELIEKYRLHFGRGTDAALAARAAWNARSAGAGNVSARFLEGHLEAMAPRICAVLRESRPQDLLVEAGGGLHAERPTTGAAAEGLLTPPLLVPVGPLVTRGRAAGGGGRTGLSASAPLVEAEAPTPSGGGDTVSLSVGEDDRVRIQVPSAADRYHVLYYRSDADDADTEYAVAIHPGAAGGVTLTEPLRAGAGGAYRVATYLNSAPGDQDGDGTDDLAELARTEAGDRAPLNAAAAIAIADGAVAIPDIGTYRTLSRLVNSAGSHRGKRELVKFIVTDAGSGDETVYFMNTNKWLGHYVFGVEFLGWDRPLNETMETLSGGIVYYPNVVAPSGEVGTFRFQLDYRHPWSFADVAMGHEVLAASMPFLRNNLVFYPMRRALETYKREKASYDGSRVPVYLKGQYFERSVFSVLNPAVGYGLLRVVGSGERPTFRDVAILRHLPNELPTVAGVISLERQTPLSHVNLRAIQDRVPNAYVGNALDDTMVAGLVGRYVRYEVSSDPGKRFSWTNPETGTVEERLGYLVTETTAEEVAAHHESRRPAEGQTPARDLTVTTYRALDAIAFADADAFGVKAANLAALRTFALTDVEVPDGYALPFYYYDAFMKHNGFYDDIDGLLEDEDFQADIGERDEELKKLRRRIENGAVPEWMTTSLGTLQGLFAEGTSIRCRSSTNNEDLPGFSGAGLYDSYTHHATEGHLEKSVKQVFASLWNLRAFEEREFYRVDHKAAAMGVLLHPNFSDELANGVAVSDDPIYFTEEAYYVNAQVGEELVTNPSSAVSPEELLLAPGEEDGEYAETLVSRSNLLADDERVLADAHVATLHAALGTIHARFETLYEVDDEEEFAMEIEFKVTADDVLAIKQARPWVY